METPTLQVIIGSTRPGRVGPALAGWFAELARADARFDVEVVDLAEVNLPLLDEPHHPRLQKYTRPHTIRWSETVSRGDAFVLVHPEYNFGINAALKNALDYLVNEWRHKPVSFVSYGGVSGGLRAAAMIKQVVHPLGMVPVANSVTVPFVAKAIDAEGRFVPNELMVESAVATLGDLRSMVDALEKLRT